MTFKATIECDACGCCNEVELDCRDAADAEDAVFEVADSGWFVNYAEGYHYCPSHAQAAKEEYEEENPPLSGIRPTMVG
ncbi:hypothetical protein ACIL2N_000325 [Vibrio metschnikovii]|nr:hypothetical protein [Vibrio metschnikovii]